MNNMYWPHSARTWRNPQFSFPLSAMNWISNFSPSGSGSVRLCLSSWFGVTVEQEAASDGPWHPEDPASPHLRTAVWHLRLPEHRLRDHRPHRPSGPATHPTAGTHTYADTELASLRCTLIAFLRWCHQLWDLEVDFSLALQCLRLLWSDR